MQNASDMISQPNSLCRGILKHSCRPSTRSRGRTPTGWALGVRSHIRAFSASVQQRAVANQHDDQALRSSCWSVLSSSASTIVGVVATYIYVLSSVVRTIPDYHSHRVSVLPRSRKPRYHWAGSLCWQFF